MNECVTELQEQCVQDDVSLASSAAELARTVGAAGEGKTREAFYVLAGPSLDHRDGVEQLVGHQAVPTVTKILNTNEAVLTESGRRESLKEYFILRESGAGASGARQHRERRACRQRKLTLCLKSIDNDAGGQIKARLVALGNALFDKHMESVTDALAHAKSVSGRSSRCAIMTTYVDDCDLDAAKPLRTLVWKVVRTQLAAERSPV